MAIIPVPDSTAFKLSDVLAAMDTFPAPTTLSGAYNSALSSRFDPTYNTSGDQRLSNFRNYGAVPEMASTNVTLKASYPINSTSVARTGIFVNSSGTVMMIQQDKGNVERYNLTTAWNFNTAIYQGVQGEHTNDPGWNGAWYSPDGMKGYKTYSRSSTDKVIQNNYYNAWETSPYSRYDEIDFPGTLALDSIMFNDDGTKLWVLNSYNEYFYEYDLITPWDLKTAGLARNFFVQGVTGQEPRAFWWNNDFTRLFFVGMITQRVVDMDAATPGTIINMPLVTAHSTTFTNSLLDDIKGAFHIPETNRILTVQGVNNYVREWELTP